MGPIKDIGDRIVLLPRMKYESGLEELKPTLNKIRGGLICLYAVSVLIWG